MRIAFLGFGLIAGSVALALRSADDPRWARARLAAWSPSGHGPRDAARDGVLDMVAADPAAALEGADLVVLGPPPLEVLGLIDRLAGPLRDALPATAVVTDVASTKATIVDRASRRGIRFVGGHPMAGREQAGYAAAVAELFAGRPWVVVPPAGAAEADVELVEALARASGAVPLRMAAADHDSAAAAISHAPLVLAVALVEAIAGGPGDGAGERAGWAGATRLAAGGWRDMTRLARGDVAMGAGIVATNAGPLADRLRAVSRVLDEWLAELERAGGPDPDRIARRLQAARDRLATAASGD